ncbi:MAG: hypothetical protein CMB64_04700 [Euryarchaeota archaeon]|nr:hypothetical protein [Euryarchaeota archaeon]|tara:strand:- start:1777 stop:2097 length:321 start_codon:yes stop_codon:yes gene_type:complete
MNKSIKEEVDTSVFYFKEIYKDLSSIQFDHEISNIILQNNYKQIREVYENEKEINKRLKTCRKIIENLDINLQYSGWQVIFTHDKRDIFYYHNCKTNETRKISWSY